MLECFLLGVVAEHLKPWQMMWWVGPSEELECSTYFQCSVMHHAPLWLSFKSSSLSPSFQFYFHLIISVSLTHHIQIIFSLGNCQCSQFSDCNKLFFMLLSFLLFSIAFFSIRYANKHANKLFSSSLLVTIRSPLCQMNEAQQ